MFGSSTGADGAGDTDGILDPCSLHTRRRNAPLRRRSPDVVIDVLPEMMQHCEDCLELVAEDLADNNEYRGHCLHCRQEISAQGGVEWRRAVRRPCPHCGRAGWWGRQPASCAGGSWHRIPCLHGNHQPRRPPHSPTFAHIGPTAAPEPRKGLL